MLVGNGAGRPAWELGAARTSCHAATTSKTNLDVHSAVNQDKLGFCCVEWSSKRMTSCAGTCSFLPRGGGCVIRLSEPILKYRPAKDLKEVMMCVLDDLASARSVCEQESVRVGGKGSFLFGALALAVVFGRVVNCVFYVVYDPYVFSTAWTMLLLWPVLCDTSMV
jgi:hypothetical protein